MNDDVYEEEVRKGYWETKEEGHEEVRAIRGIESNVLRNKAKQKENIEENNVNGHMKKKDMEDETIDVGYEEHRVNNIKNQDGYMTIEGKMDDYYVKEQKNIKDNETNFHNKYNRYGYSINGNMGYDNRAVNYAEQVANYTLNILKFFQEVEPFEYSLENYRFWEVEYDEKNAYKGFLPFYNYMVNMYYPYPFMSRTTTCQSLMRRYDHYIFGILEQDNDIKYYVYGVPGRFTLSDQPYRGTTGFVTWVESKMKSTEKVGYWLLHIEPLSGKIVTPLTPTKPRR